MTACRQGYTKDWPASLEHFSNVLVCACVQLQQVRHAASSLERVAGAMARQAAADHPGRDDGVRFTVGPVDGRASRDGQGDSRRRSH